MHFFKFFFIVHFLKKTATLVKKNKHFYNQNLKVHLCVHWK